jgi:hypothetical protein
MGIIGVFVASYGSEDEGYEGWVHVLDIPLLSELWVEN